MPREVVALVSADDTVAAVRVHADRVHDLLLRSGCGPQEAVEVCESYAFALIDALVNAPETVGDMAGWWFGRALELGRRLGSAAAEPTEEQSTSVLAGTTGEAQVRAALASLPEIERTAVVLRDAYDLPPEAVAVALRRDVDSASALAAAGRLRLVAHYDSRPIPDLDGHTGRTPADLAVLGRLADGSLPPQRQVPMRRHLSTCTACEEVAEVMAKGRRLAAGLPVIAMPDDAREAMLERVRVRATEMLPTVDEVLLAIEADADVDRPALSPIAVVLAIVLALVLGVAVAAATRTGGSGEQTLASQPPTEPSVAPSFPLSATPTVTPTPTKSASPRASRSATSTPSSVVTTAQSSAPPPRSASISLAPDSGPRGSRFAVDGSGWPAGAVVTVTYSGGLSSSRTTVTADGSGAFSTTLAANGIVPGDYTVRAQGAGRSATATFAQTT